MSSPTLSSNFSSCDSLTRFLAKSHDCYPIGMVMNAFVDPTDNDAFNQLIHGDIPANLKNVIRQHSRVFHYDSSNNKLYIKNIESNNLCNILKYVFGIPIVIQKDENNYFPGINYIRPYELMPERSSLFSMDENQIKKEFSFEEDLRTWVLGQGELDLSLYTLSQAYARLISKKNISLNYMQHSVNNSLFTDEYFKDHLDLEGNGEGSKIHAWDNFLAKWTRAQNYDGATFQATKQDFETARTAFPSKSTAAAILSQRL